MKKKQSGSDLWQITATIIHPKWHVKSCQCKSILERQYNGGISGIKL